jgi:tetratricopeptide (TPR) repeat protein
MMKRIFLQIYILLHVFLSFGQNSDLEKLLKKSDSKEKVIALNKRSEQLWQSGEYSEGMRCAEKAFEVSKRLNLNKEKADALNNIGIIHDYQGRYAEALEVYFDAIKIQKLIRDQAGLAYTYNNIGLIYSNQKDYKNSLKYYNLALDIRKKTNDQIGISSTYNNIGILQMYQGNYGDALLSYQASVKIDSLRNNLDGQSASYSNIGLVFMDQGDYENAHKYFNKALEIRKKTNDKRGIANSYNNLSSLYFKEKDFERAKYHAQRGLEIGLSMGAKDLIIYSYQMLYQIAEAQNNFKVAFDNYKQFIVYGDSLTNEDNTRKQTEAEMQFKFDQEKAQENLARQKKELINKQEKQRQFYLIIGLSVIVVISLFFAFSLNKQRKKELQQKIQIEEQKRLVELKNNEIMDSITYAKRIQSAILPPDRLVKEYLIDSFVIYKPKDIVAGDFYWIEPIKDHVLFAVADCTGHGVPGALVSVVCHNALNRAVREFNLNDPGQILNKCRDLIIEEFIKSDENVKDGMDISICSLNLNNQTILWAGANSPLWVYRHSSNQVDEFKPFKQPIGQFELSEPFVSQKINLSSGDGIYLFSDGYADQFGGEKGKKLKTSGQKALILNIAGQTMQKQKSSIECYFDDWKGQLEQIDDVCMIGVRIP